MSVAEQASFTTLDAIRSTAVDLFSTVGYAGASMRQIAAAVGIKPASLYNHYPSKEEILWEIVQAALKEILRGQKEAFSAHAVTVDRLCAFVRVHAAFHARESQLARVVNNNLSGLVPRHYRKAVADRARYEHGLRDLLAAGVQEGIFDVPDTKITSYAILEMGMGISIWFRPDGPLSVDEVARRHEELALRMVGHHGGR